MMPASPVSSARFSRGTAVWRTGNDDPGTEVHKELPPELTRKGRFDEIFFVDLPNAEERREIFTVHLRKRKRDPRLFDLAELVAASDGFSGAEIEQAVVAGLYTAFSRGVEVSSAIIVEELKATKPLSVTRGERTAALRTWARDRTAM